MHKNKAYIIAEAGVNHNGEVKIAELLIKEAARVGADAIKFQTFDVEKIVHPMAPSAPYQKEACQQNTQSELLSKLQLSYEDFRHLKKVADKNHITFLSTPFDEDALEFLDQLRVPYIKISSGDLTYAPFLLRIAHKGLKVFLSTGASTLSDIWNALYVLSYGYLNPSKIPSSTREILDSLKKEDVKKILKEKVTIFHCTSEYPAPFNDINLNVLDTYKNEFGLDVGYSDHSSGIIVPCLAVAKGASVIEKHFTLDKKMEGPDHKASLDVGEFEKMIEQIRLTETILGRYDKFLTFSEKANETLIKRGVYLSKDMEKGDILNDSDILFLRPKTRVSPLDVWDLIEKPVHQDYKKGDAL